MPKPKSTTSTVETISDVMKVTRKKAHICILGVSPLICNRMSEKAKHELWMPKGRKTAVDKMTMLKHNPIEEYRASVYKLPEPSPTLIGIMSSAFKGAMAGAALDLPGQKKAQIGRLTYVDGDYVSIYGVPTLHIAVVRSADMNRTPDIRTRAALKQWACRVTVSYVEPLIRLMAVGNLMAAGGMTQGVGDGRVEKGKLNFGQFELVDDDDPRFLGILATGGRAVQEAAMQTPECYDDEATEMMTWFEGELDNRKLRGVA